jgi:hypothetical protein
LSFFDISTGGGKRGRIQEPVQRWGLGKSKERSATVTPKLVAHVAMKMLDHFIF